MCKELLQTTIPVVGTLLGTYIGIKLTNKFNNEKEDKKNELTTKVNEYIILSNIDENLKKANVIYKNILSNFAFTLQFRKEEYKNTFKSNPLISARLEDVINKYEKDTDSINLLLQNEHKKNLCPHKDDLEDKNHDEIILLEIFDVSCVNSSRDYERICDSISLETKDDKGMTEIIYALTRKLSYEEISVLDNFNKNFKKLDELLHTDTTTFDTLKNFLKIKEIISLILDIKMFSEQASTKKTLDILRKDLN